MLGSNFYHGSIRKYVILFGSLFTDIYIDRVDANNVSQKTIKVPIQYGPKERYLTRYIQNPDLLREVSMVFPRMSFEITNISYDPDRKLPTIGSAAAVNVNGNTLNSQYNPVAYNFDITLSDLYLSASSIGSKSFQSSVFIEGLFIFYTNDRHFEYAIQ